MANKIIWDPSLDTTIATYKISYATVYNGPWNVLINIPHDISGPNYGSNSFFYVDYTNPPTTWYSVTSIDQLGQESLPSIPFQAGGVPLQFVPGSTPFGVFDNDPEFQFDADRIFTFTKQKLGDPIMEVHLSSTQAYAAFEEACLEYSAMVNSYQAKSVLATFLGSPATLSGSENKFANRNMQMQLAMADAFAAEAGVNSNLPVHKGMIELTPGQQTYDLPTMLSASGLYAGPGRIRVREIFHLSPMSAYRFFGTTSGLNYLNNQFRFESFTPETLFYLLPVWEDILRGMQFKTSNNVRRSNYSYALHNNHLSIFPAPSDKRNLFFEYTIDPNPQESSNPAADATRNGVANLSNIPFGNIQYRTLNSISKHWIRRMSHALAKEIEGQIRSKMSSIPIPNGDLNLNGPELITDARAEQESLRTELKEMLEETTYQKLMEKEMQMAQSLQETFKNVPMGIFVG
jgi:hypothetical protein